MNFRSRKPVANTRVECIAASRRAPAPITFGYIKSAAPHIVQTHIQRRQAPNLQYNMMPPVASATSLYSNACLMPHPSFQLPTRARVIRKSQNICSSICIRLFVSQGRREGHHGPVPRHFPIYWHATSNNLNISSSGASSVAEGIQPGAGQNSKSYCMHSRDELFHLALGSRELPS